jgi:hypothetical protein
MKAPIQDWHYDISQKILTPEAANKTGKLAKEYLANEWGKIAKLKANEECNCRKKIDLSLPCCHDLLEMKQYNLLPLNLLNIPVELRRENIPKANADRQMEIVEEINETVECFDFDDLKEELNHYLEVARENSEARNFIINSVKEIRKKINTISREQNGDMNFQVHRKKRKKQVSKNSPIHLMKKRK